MRRATRAASRARVDVELLVRPQQSVSIRGDPGVQSDGGSSQPIWGAGGFTVQQYGSLRLKNLVIAAALAAQSQLPFVSVKGPELLNKYIGASEAAARSAVETN